MKIAILGAAGNMGRWLIRYFLERGHTLIASDPNDNELRGFTEIESTNDNESAVQDADLVVISVPMGLTADVIRDVAPHMKKNAILCEIASVKSRAVETLKEVSVYPVTPLSLHPLFGPGAHLLNKRIALIPILDLEKEKQLVYTLFPDSEVIVVDAEQHDRIMAVTLSLPYFVNMTVASVLKDEDLTILNQLSGTTFALQLILTGSIMSHSSEFHVALHKENNHVSNVLKKLISNAQLELNRLVDDDVESFEQSYNSIKETLEEGMSLQEKYEEMYRVLEVLETNPNLELEP